MLMLAAKKIIFGVWVLVFFTGGTSIFNLGCGGLLYSAKNPYLLPISAISIGLFTRKFCTQITTSHDKHRTNQSAKQLKIYQEVMISEFSKNVAKVRDCGRGFML
jgi:hypothetical protein